MTKEERAVMLFANNYNCAQSVLGAFALEEGLDLETALKLANGFGGGVRSGDLCGAISGAVMVIGLKCGFHKENDLTQKAYCNAKSHEFVEKFKEKNGSGTCRELLGINIRHPDDHNTPEAKEAHQSICPKLVASAVVILEGMDIALPS